MPTFHISLRALFNKLVRKKKEVEDDLRTTVTGRLSRTSVSSVDHGPGASGDDDLSSLLSMLNKKEPGSSIDSVVNTTTIHLLCNLLYPEDYVSVATRLSEISDVANLLDFILHLIHNRLLSGPDASIDLNPRARRLTLKIISTNPVIPRSLIMTDVKVPAKRDYVGSGAYGGVFKGELRGGIIALKVLFKSGNVAFCREALTWAMLKHEFVLSFLGICEEQDETFLVSPYMGNGTLAQWRNRAKPLIAEIWKRILEVAQGMRYIHSEGIVHGDLRGANVLLDANLHVQIADFGLTRLMGMTDTETGAKHINFSAPELFGYVEDANAPLVNESTRTQMSDVYAFGCLYYEIHYDSIPFAGRHEGQIVNLVIQDKRPSRLYDPPLSDEAWGIIQRCWEREPWKRRGMQDVVESLISASQSRTTKSQNYEMLIKESLPAPSVTFRNAQAHRRDSNGSTLPLLLSMLKDKKPGSSIASVVNATTINLTWKLLSSEDYVSVTDDLNKASDVQNLLDFMLHLLRDHRLPHQDPTVIIDQRARRFMMKVISKVPVMPPSLIVTGVRIPANRSYLHGGFGSVFKGEFQGSTVALRVLHKTGNNIAFCREALMWHSLTHKFVLPLLGIYEGEDGRAPQAFLVSPYMENGTLAQWRRDSLPPIAEIEKRILQVAQGLEYIHSEGIVHGDIRGSNVLLDGNLHVQIADFGLTRVSEATTTGSGALHINFAAPELFGFSENDDSFEGAPARTQMSDIYAFGCLYYEIHYDTVPFVGKTDFQVLALASRGILPSRLEDQPLSDLAWDVIQRCWTREPSKRPRMKDVVESVMWLMLNR